MSWSRRIGAPTAISVAVLGVLAVPAAARATPIVTVHHSAIQRPIPPPPGALAAAFVANQFTYCSLICPHILDFVIDVPVAVVRAPGVFTVAQARTHSVDRSAGIALASVTAPANSAMNGIIGNDLNLVLPRAQNALEVAVVEMLRVADTAQSGSAPGAVSSAFDTARSRILDALHAPVVIDPPQLATPTTPAQAAALDAIDVGSAVLFRAPEMLMVGATSAADDAADELATTGNVARARDTGAASFSNVIEQANGVIHHAIANRHRPVPTRAQTGSKYSPTGSGLGTLDQE
ncbi:hypothetical protein [Gordonia insulae]|uniref:Uncharacterized protein n=1 Tax=Gordonia insulae TaxID=2420509 RepID=A0A3G8JPU4_9ACTN|nr:hypothetical protein [Gordonia insulae]AZG47134.1 hypothetical protein D7316_03742 [Gordonia insulae]